MKVAKLLIQCLENEGVSFIFGLPGEENMDLMDALIESPIEFITTRHEQGAAFMADVYGRLTGKAGVCLATLGPGATNLITGVADAQLDRAPLVAIAGQAATTQLHKESHQVLDLVNLFKPVSKYAVSVRAPETIPEIIRKAFKVAQTEKPGVSFIELSEDIAASPVEKAVPLTVGRAALPHPPGSALELAAKIISRAKSPLLMAGNGVVRTRAFDSLARFAASLNIPVANTFMAKGVLPFSDVRCLGTVGMQSRDYVSCGFEHADVILCAGYDMVEYPSELWHPGKNRRIIHIDTAPADVDAHYLPEVELVGDIGAALDGIARLAKPVDGCWYKPLRESIVANFEAGAGDAGYPLHPRRIIWELRHALNPEDIVVCDVGAHKIWMARLYPAQHPNTCLISNGFAAMGIALPGAIAAKKTHPDRNVVAVTGDGGFLMNSQEIETAMRLHLPVVVLVWNDGTYGLIKWKQDLKFGRSAGVDFQNPDLVGYAQSFGAKGYRVERPEDLGEMLKIALRENTLTLIDCPVSYQANLDLSAQLEELTCPVPQATHSSLSKHGKEAL